MSALWCRPMWRGGVCMRLSGVRLLPRRRRVCPGGQSLSLCGLKEESNQRERAQYEFERPSSSDAGALATHLTRYGHEFRLHRGAPRLGDDTCRTRPFGSVKSQALPDQSDFSARSGNTRAHRPKHSCSGSLSLVTFFLSQQKESDRPPGRPRRRLTAEKNMTRSDSR